MCDGNYNDGEIGMKESLSSVHSGKLSPDIHFFGNPLIGLKVNIVGAFDVSGKV